MSVEFEKRIARAMKLAESSPAARDFLKFYVKVARFQNSVFAELSLKGESDVRRLTRFFPALLELVRSSALDPLIDFAIRRLQSAEAREELLLKCWDGGTLAAFEESGEGMFFARALLQPFAEALANRGQRDFEQGKPTCPFCNARPVVAVLRGEGDGAKRWLLCSICSTEWQFRRLVCPNCGEQDKDKLPIFTAAGLDYVRVEACDGCRTYIKSVNLTKDGCAIPVVDELATVTLNIWADKHGYTKLECNLLGF